MTPFPRSVLDGMNLLRISDRRLFKVMAVVAVLVAINAVLACINTVRLHDTLGLVTHTHKVLETIAATLAASQEAEAQQRSCLITGDMRYFEQYRAARADAERIVADLEALVHDNPDQLPRVAMLREHFAACFAILEEGVSTLQEGNFETARQVVVSGRGKDAMDTARATMDAMRVEEQHLLEERVADAQHSRTSALASAVAAGLLALLAIGAFTRLLRRQIRERSAAAAALRAEKERFRTTLASIGDGVITTDTATAVTFLNAVAEELTGWKHGDAAGQPLQRVFHIINEDSGDLAENPAVRALRDGVIVGLANHTVLRTPAGDEHPIDDSAAPIRAADGTIIGSVLVFRDVTARRNAERELRDADTRKDRFLALLAHELRNPLAPLRTSLEIMQYTQDPAQLAHVRGVMKRQLEQMVRLVDDLLDVSRIASNKHEMRFELVDIATVVSSALETFRPVLSQSGQKLVTTLPDEPCFLRADPVRLAQVLYNLLNNASKFSARGTTISLVTAREREQLVIRVSDEGVGVPPEMLDRIFDMFEQVDHSLERSRSGLGVGLTLVRRLVEMHGGSVVARSEGAGRGSDFIVTLSTVDVPGVAPERARPAPAVESRRILVADDNVDAADSLARLLRLRGHQVRVTHDGNRALEEALAFRPEIVLLDIGMPGQNGYEVAPAIRTREPGRDRLLIAVTGWSSDDVQRLTREAGFDHHLVKPIDLESLEAILGRATSPGT